MIQGVSRRRLCWTWQPVTISLFVACSSGWAQTTRPVQRPTTTQPAPYDHEAMLERAAKEPLIKMELKTPAGDPLTEAQQAEVRAAEALMSAAQAARQAGNFTESAERASAALETRTKILGPRHFLTVSARVRTATLREWSGLTDDARRKLVDADKLLSAANTLEDKGEYARARSDARKALALYEEVLRKDHVEIGMALLRLAYVLCDEGDYEQAAEVLTRAAPMMEKAYGKNHPQIGRLLDRIGWVHVNLPDSAPDKPREEAVQPAITALGSAVRIYRSTVGENADLAESLDNLGTALVVKRNIRYALDCKLRALVVREQVLGPAHKDTAVSLTNLAWLYERADLRDEVIPLRKRALKIFEQALGPNHPYTLLEKGKLASAFMARQRHEEAIVLFEQLVAGDAAGAGDIDAGSIRRLTQLGRAYLQVDRLPDARRTFADAEGKAEALIARGEDAPARTAFLAMSSAYLRFRMLDDGLRVQERLVALDNKRRGNEDRLALVKRVSKLGGLYIEVGRWEDAERVLTEAVARLKALVGHDNIQVAAPLLRLVYVYEHRGELEKAEGLCDEVVRLSETQRRRKAPGTAYALMQMGRIYALQDRFDLAKFALEEAQGIFKHYDKRDPDGNVRILHEWANYYGRKGENAQAVVSLREALDRCRQWEQMLPSAHDEAALAETLKLLLDATASGEGATEQERQAWRQELISLLKTSLARQALGAKEKAWAKELGILTAEPGAS